MTRFSRILGNRTLKGALGSALLLIIGSISSTARADFEILNSQVCWIEENDGGYDFSDFTRALDYYDRDSNRYCTWEISFRNNGTMRMTEKVTVGGAPVHNGYGMIIRGYPGVANFILDARGQGNCPIMVTSDSLIDIKRMTIQVDNKDTAICTTQGTPLYSIDSRGNITQTAGQEDYVLIHDDVTITEEGALNPDGDGDGVTDDHDDCPGTPPGTMVNGDGCPDRDGDGIPDNQDNCPADPILPESADSDGDGVGDACDNCPAVRNANQSDGDHDGTGDACDDSDGDGVVDLLDLCTNTPPETPIASDGCTDSDRDGVSDGNDNCPDVANPSQANSDPGMDDVGDACDDSDGDGVVDANDRCSGTPEDSQVASDGCLDRDGDNIADDLDNCPGVSNPAQEDGNGNGAGDYCDDSDGDGILDIADRCDGALCEDDEGDRVWDDAVVPTCDLSAAINPAGGFDLTWSSTNAATITLSDGTTDLSMDPSGMLTVTPASSTTYTLSVANSSGTCSRSVILTPAAPVPPSPACTLTSTPNAAGGFDLTWATTDATTVELSDGAAVLSTDPSGTVTVNPAVETTYSLSATGAGGSCLRSITITPPAPLPPAPTCDLNAATDASGGFHLSWGTTDATTVSLSDGASVLSTDSAGTLNVTPGTETTYTLSATGTGGSCSRSITVTPGVPPLAAPTCTLTSAGSAAGGFDLTWSTTDASTVSLAQGATLLSTASSGTVNVNPTAATSYQLAATGVGGSCSSQLTLAPAGTFVDSDGDGISDATEGSIGTNPNLADSDGDGTIDPLDCAPLDPTHATGATCQFESPDLDGDGVPNGSDNCPFVSNANQADGDADGVGDACDLRPSESAVDSDGDGIPDDIETNVFRTDPFNRDTDGDGLTDGQEVSSVLYPTLSPLDPDSDHDGVCDGPGTVLAADGTTVCAPVTAGQADNCPIAPNGPNTPNLNPSEVQLDSDGDGTGDICEGDRDGDLILDENDNCPIIDNADQADRDQNGIGDECDPNLTLSAGSGGCGCRIEGGPTSLADMVPFGFLILPLVLLRRLRKGLSVGL